MHLFFKKKPRPKIRDTISFMDKPLKLVHRLQDGKGQILVSRQVLKKSVGHGISSLICLPICSTGSESKPNF
jgi:hypothetical protein